MSNQLYVVIAPNGEYIVNGPRRGRFTTPDLNGVRIYRGLGAVKCSQDCSEDTKVPCDRYPSGYKHVPPRKISEGYTPVKVGLVII